MIAYFHKRGFLDRGSNATFISLILKKEGVDRLFDFRLVSLIGSTYKIIFKCLTLRLKTTLSVIISKEQGVFGREIHTGWILLC